MTPVSRPFAIPVHAAIKELATQSAAYDFGAEFRALLPRAADIDAGATATIHGEVNLSNCLARADGTIVLIDWDQAGYGRIALDLGYPLVCVFLTEDLDWRSPMAAAFYKAYQKHRPLADAEQIFDAALFHAMRYMAFHNVDRRWRRVQHAARHKAALMSVLSQLRPYADPAPDGDSSPPGYGWARAAAARLASSPPPLEVGENGHVGGAVVRTARAIAAAEGLPTDTVVEVAGLGSVNHVYVVGSGPDRWVVRFARDPRSPNVFASEAWSAERAARLGIPTPAPIRHGAVDGVAYAAYRYLSGRQVAEANVPHGWLDLASYGQRINSIQPDNSTPQSFFTRFGRDLQQAWTLHLEYNLELLDGSDPLLAAHAYTDRQQARFREAIHELATVPMSFGLSHGDMTLRNLLIRDSAPAALIDWGSASFGPVPWTDLLVLDQEDRDPHNATRAGFDSYLDALGLNGDTVRPVFERLRLLHLLDLIRWALDQRPDRIATAVTDLQWIM